MPIYLLGALVVLGFVVQFFLLRNELRRHPNAQEVAAALVAMTDEQQIEVADIVFDLRSGHESRA
jgi:hypothetical protein